VTPSNARPRQGKRAQQGSGEPLRGPKACAATPRPAKEQPRSDSLWPRASTTTRKPWRSPPRKYWRRDGELRPKTLTDRRPACCIRLAACGITLLRPSRKDETTRHGEPLLKTIRQLIESVNDTLKGQLDLEAHGGRTFEGVAIRVAQRVLAMAAAIWHNNKTGRPVTRSLIAYDH
jgi:hypothetical protein